MVGTIIAAVVYNLVAALILVSGILSATRDGVKVTLVKLIMMLGGGVGAYFLTPVLNRKFYGIEGMTTILEGKISVATVNSGFFFLWFLAFYALTLIVCNIVRHCLIKKLRNKKLNKLKMKRAKSINPSAERAAKRAEWKSLKLKYSGSKKWYHKLLCLFLGALISVTLGYVVLMPVGYLAKDMKKDYLVKGYEYTLNGVVGEKVSDFILKIEKEAPVETPELSLE